MYLPRESLREHDTAIMVNAAIKRINDIRKQVFIFFGFYWDKESKKSVLSRTFVIEISSFVGK